MKLLKTLSALLRLGRLHFLIGGVILYMLGVVIALVAGAPLNLAAVVWGQVAITTMQLMTHYANDYFDLEADRANTTPTNWSGGSRVLLEDNVSARSALRIALLLAGAAFVVNLILSFIVAPGELTFGILLLTQALAWFYSAPPLRLHSRGLGELTTTVVVTLLTPLIGYVLQTGAVTLLPVLAVAPLCCFQFAMLLSINFPDAEGDALVGKRTLVVIFGASTAARLYMTAVLLGYAILPVLVVLGLPLLVAGSVVLWSPLAVWQLWRMARGDWRDPARWNGLAFYTIVLLIGASAAQLAAWVLLVGTRAE